MSASTLRSSYTIGHAIAPLGTPTAAADVPAFRGAESLEITNWEWRNPGSEREHPDYPHPKVQARCVRILRPPARCRCHCQLHTPHHLAAQMSRVPPPPPPAPRGASSGLYG